MAALSNVSPAVNTLPRPYSALDGMLVRLGLYVLRLVDFRLH